MHTQSSDELALYYIYKAEDQTVIIIIRHCLTIYIGVRFQICKLAPVRV